ncbi:hypothetical protein [Streptomyces sp. NPDC093225]|uniref:hypothetical protein n=1 Tax=Streptomyces sp. NPDC093225 TaxID=3366034 RepID=UPI003814D4BB
MTLAALPEPSPARAGALRVTADRTTTPAFTEYLDAVAAHCPYLAPSVRYGLTYWTTYAIEPGVELFDVEAGLFSAAVAAAERVRLLAKGARGHLVCENLVVAGAARRHLDWPHWALKNLYGPVGLMFGKFWEGEADTSRHGAALPVPPVTFLSIRPAVRPRDPRFLRNTPDLAEAVRDAADDGRSVFDTLGRDWAAVRSWAARLPRPTKENTP